MELLKPSMGAGRKTLPLMTLRGLWPSNTVMAGNNNSFVSNQLVLVHLKA